MKEISTLTMRDFHVILLLTVGILLPERALGQFLWQTNNGEITITRYDCSGFEVVIPAVINGLPVTQIGDGAFQACNSVITVSGGGNIRRIGADAFKQCERLSSVAFQDSLQEVGRGAFAYCTNLTSVSLGKSLRQIEDYAFDTSGVGPFAAPASLTNIGAYAFRLCGNMTSANLGTNLSTIGRAAFWGSGLKSITIPGSLRVVSDNAFAYCGDLTRVELLEGVTDIDRAAFYSCVRLSEVALPLSLRTIGFSGFTLTSLSAINLPMGVEALGDNCFSGCSGLTSLYLPASVIRISNNFVHGSPALSNIQVAPDNAAYASLDGVLFDKNLRTLLRVPEGRTGDYVPPDSVRVIGPGALYWCKEIKSVTMPKGVLQIGLDAFERCTSLEWLSIPETVTQIDAYAFYFCSKIPSVSIPNSVLALGPNAFKECTSLTTATIGRNLRYIPEGVFDGAPLQSLYFLGNGPAAEPMWANRAYYLPGTTGWGPSWNGIPTSPWVLPYPVIVDMTTPRSVGSSPFGFIISWQSNAPVVIESSAAASAPVWEPVRTNTTVNGWSWFADPGWTNYPSRLYRVRPL